MLDLLRERSPADLDAVTTATTAELTQAGGKPVGGPVETRQWRRNGTVLEVSPLRDVRLAEDLGARDFSIHAIAMQWPGGALVDPCGGMADLEAGLLRHPDPARDPFAADALRILRGWRRHAEGFAWQADTARLARQAVAGLKHVAPARFGSPWLKLLAGDRAGESLRDMAEWPGLLAALHPCFGMMAEGPPPEGHRLDPWRHSSRVLELLPADAPAERLAALFHDTGKALPRVGAPHPWLPETVAADIAPWRIEGHAALSAEILLRTAAAWSLPRTIADPARQLVAAHTFRPGDLLADRGQLRRWLAAHGPHTEALLRFRRADRTATDPDKPHADILALADLCKQEEAAAWPRRPADLHIDSAALLAALGATGAERGRLLERLWQWVLDDPEHRDKPAALQDQARVILQAFRETVPDD